MTFDLRLTMAQKVPDIVLKLQHLAKPTFMNGRWRKAAIGGRKLAGIRKAMVASGVYWPPKDLRDRSQDKPLKLIKHERNREERCAIILAVFYCIVLKFIERRRLPKT